MEGTTITLNFPNGMRPPEHEIIGKAIAELIKLRPEGPAEWRLAINGSPEDAYELGRSTVELME